MVYKKVGGSDPGKKQIDKTFHGLPGTVSLREIGAKSLIT